MNAHDELRLIQQALQNIAAFTPLDERYVHLLWNYCLTGLRDDIG